MVAKKPETTQVSTPPVAAQPRRRLSQTEVPSIDVNEALRVPRALRDQCGSQPTAPLLVGRALGLQPSSGGFRLLTGAAAAYGLTEGAAQGATISLTDLGRRVVSPTTEGDDVAALREAVLRPRVVREFLQKYNNVRFPAQVIALNVLTEEMNVPREAAEKALATIRANAEAVGYLEEINGNPYVLLGNGPAAPTVPTIVPAPPLTDAVPMPAPDVEVAAPTSAPTAGLLPDGRPSSDPVQTLAANNRVFISHGKNKDIVNQLQEVLKFGNFEAVVSVNNEATAKPVPEKVMDDMRSCAAGIVHVSAERKLLDPEGKEHTVLNPNVLIEIGAALALYKNNFILLVETGVELPSNLQGLYQVRYNGDTLDYEATMKLLRAFNEFKTA